MTLHMAETLLDIFSKPLIKSPTDLNSIKQYNSILKVTASKNSAVRLNIITYQHINQSATNKKYNPSCMQ